MLWLLVPTAVRCISCRLYWSVWKGPGIDRPLECFQCQGNHGCYLVTYIKPSHSKSPIPSRLWEVEKLLEVVTVTLPRAQRKHTAARRSWPRPRHVMETPACQANNTINEKQQKSPSSLKQDNEINDYNFQNCNSQYSEDSYITYSVSLTFTLQNMEV